MKKMLLLGIVLFALMQIVREESYAIPAFARKYKTSCATCHNGFPKLNAFGEAFRRNGYQFPGGLMPNLPTKKLFRSDPKAISARFQTPSGPEASPEVLRSHYSSTAKSITTQSPILRIHRRPNGSVSMALAIVLRPWPPERLAKICQASKFDFALYFRATRV